VCGEHVGGLPITGDLAVGKVRRAGLPSCRHGHGRARSKTLDVELTLVVCAGVGEELTGGKPRRWRPRQRRAPAGQRPALPRSAWSCAVVDLAPRVGRYGWLRVGEKRFSAEF
jgi:hypothetical protein